MGLITLQTVSKSFGKKVVLNNLSLTLQEGEFVCVLGRSGSGKTTLLRVLAGFETLDAGRILYSLQNVKEPIELSSSTHHVAPERRNMGVVFQDHALWPHMTVFENVAFPLRMQNHTSDIIQTRVIQSLSDVAMQHLADAYPHQLSGGESQRVALARTLTQNPSCILFDEPLASLDTGLRYELQGLMKHLHKERRFTALYITHDMGEAMRMADRMAVMADGHILQYDAPERIYHAPKSVAVASFLGASSVLPITEYKNHTTSFYTFQKQAFRSLSDQTLTIIPAAPETKGMTASPKALILRPNDIVIDRASNHNLDHNLTLTLTLYGMVSECFFMNGEYEICLDLVMGIQDPTFLNLTLRIRRHHGLPHGTLCVCHIQQGTVTEI